jgi:sigma-B regulation protein RsbU (phosphoserine phosphatase)
VEIIAPLTRIFAGTHARSVISLIVFAVSLQVLFPIFSLAAGFRVLWARPFDRNAWLVFAILQFIQTFFAFQLTMYGWQYDFTSIWLAISSTGFTIGVLLFGLSFPERLDFDVRRPWLKWILIGPMLALLPIDLWELVARQYAIRELMRVPVQWFHVADRIESVFSIACVSAFCAGIAMQYFRAKTADARRRTRVLFLGSQIGLWPTFLIFIVATIRGTEINNAAPTWVFFTALVLFTAFPLSLAYVVIVQRAMDVRFLLRQGTQYAMARGTLIGAQVVLVLLFTWSMRQLLRSPTHRVVDLLQVVAYAALLVVFRTRGARLWSKRIDRKFFREAYSTEQVLSDLGQEAGAFIETRPLLETVTRKIAETLHIDGAAVLLRTPAGFMLQTSIGIPLGSQPVFLPGNASSITDMELRKRPATIYRDRPDEWLVNASEREREVLRELHAEVLLPLPGRTRLMGVMALGPKRSEQPYSAVDLRLLTLVGAQTGLALENSELLASLTTQLAQRERINREMEIAREVQERLFPQGFPKLAGVDVTGSCRPALGVGGDYYDCFALDGDDGNAATRLGFAVGDVSGKGISAALLMASLRASLRGQTMQWQTDLAQIIVNVNKLLFDSSEMHRYATFFFAEFDATARRLTYVNAGHNPPAVLRRAEGGNVEVIRLEAGGPVVGLLEHPRYEQRQLQMLAGDVLLAYTDGISEAMDPTDEEWGEEKMIAAAVAVMGQPSDAIMQRLFQEADKFANGAPQHDDMTLMVLKLS